MLVKYSAQHVCVCVFVRVCVCVCVCGVCVRAHAVYTRNCAMDGCNGIKVLMGWKNAWLVSDTCVTYNLMRQFMFHFLMGRCAIMYRYYLTSIEPRCTQNIPFWSIYIKMLKTVPLKLSSHTCTTIFVCRGMHILVD